MNWINIKDREPKEGQVCLVKSDYTYDGAGIEYAVFVGKYHGSYFDPSWAPARYTVWDDTRDIMINEVEVDSEEAIAWMPWEDQR